MLVSHTRDTADFNTRVIGGDDAIDQLAALHADTEGRIGVGGADIATQLLHAGLLDELLLFVHPSILGFGRPLFDDYDRPVDLDPVEQKSFGNGVTMQRFDLRGPGQKAPSSHGRHETTAGAR